MQIFHFMEKQHAIENVKKSRIKVATLNNMNDPYEFFPRFEGAADSEITKFKDHYNTKAGFLCFTRRLGDPVQWAHYADNHRGICMEFEVPHKLLNKIRYLKSPATISVSSRDWENDLVGATLCKYEGWRNEREYRVLVDLESEGVEQENDLFFAKFSKDVAPSKIYTGIRCELSDEEESVFKDNGLPILKMAQNKNSYSIVHS